jgi:hypothetical protein
MKRRSFIALVIGAAMIAEAKARASRAARRVTLKISRTNRAGLRFYERHGFALDGEEGGNCALHLGWMTRSGELAKGAASSAMSARSSFDAWSRSARG